jgi:hypothetical protein
MDMMAAIIGALDKQELFQSITTYAGLRHARFGAKPAHFSAFGDALIWSLEQQFGASFNPDLRAAWLTLYDAVRNKMITAAAVRTWYNDARTGHLAAGGAGLGTDPARQTTHEAAAKASELAGRAIDRLMDPSVAAEEQAKRKRRLIKGPREFRSIRRDPASD